jgi:S1-C subfamily serine protease
LARGVDPNGAPLVRLGAVRSLGPGWHSLAGGHIDRRITLDFLIALAEEGGPVLDAAGNLLGMSTAGPGSRALVIPAATIERVLDPLLTTGRVDRGWLGVALHPVALPERIKTEAGQDRGLMVMQVAPEGPAAKAGVLAGDILVALEASPAVSAQALLAANLTRDGFAGDCAFRRSAGPRS